MEIKINKNSHLGQGHEPYILAEIGINHNGDLQIAKKLIEEAAKVGVNGVKFQRRTINEMYKKEYLNSPYLKDGSFGATYGEHKKFLEFLDEDILELKKLAESLNVDFIVSGFDFSGFRFIEEFINPPFHKIASPLVSHFPILEEIASYGKPMIISTGMHNLEEVDKMMEFILPINNQIVLLQCTTSYPTEDEDVNLQVMNQYQRRYGVLVGYSSHDRGVILPAASVALGSCFIEKHFTLDRTMKGPDHIASVEPRGMELIVKYSKVVFRGLGDGIKTLTKVEESAKAKHGYSIVASRNLTKGTKLTMDMFNYKQPGSGLKPSEVSQLLGKELNVDIVCDQDILYTQVD